MQALFEKLALEMMDYYLGDIIRETGKIAFAGGCALNVKLNQKIIAREEVRSCSSSRPPVMLVPLSVRRPMCRCSAAFR